MKPHNSVTPFRIHMNANISPKITIISYPLNECLTKTSYVRHCFGARVTKLSIWKCPVVYSTV